MKRVITLDSFNLCQSLSFFFRLRGRYIVPDTSNRTLKFLKKILSRSKFYCLLEKIQEEKNENSHENTLNLSKSLCGKTMKL